MHFAIISPTAALRRYSILSSVHLVLPQMRDPEYWTFYKERREKGDLVILDNGAYENQNQSTIIERMMEIYRELNPQVLVLPDLLLKTAQESLDCSGQAYRLIQHDLKPETQLMYVPQAPPDSWNEWWRGLYEWFHQPWSKRVSWIGLPRALATHIRKDPLARVLAARSLVGNRRIHALGMVKGDYHELPYLDHAGVYSIDSSAPVWRGILGLRLADTIGQSFDIDFGEPAYIPFEVILENLEVCGVRTKDRG